jgi:hypothetical protein
MATDATPTAEVVRDVLALYQGRNAREILGRTYAHGARFFVFVFIHTHAHPKTPRSLSSLIHPLTPHPHHAQKKKDATFEDGLMRVAGHPAIEAQFAALPSLFSSIAITATGAPAVEAAGSVAGGPPAASPSPSAVTVPTTQAFTLRGPLPLTLTLDVDTRLTLDQATGKVVRHADAWKRVRLPGGRTLPLPGHTLVPGGWLRSFNGSLTTRLLRLGGWGKGGGGGTGPAGAAVGGGGG